MSYESLIYETKDHVATLTLLGESVESGDDSRIAEEALQPRRQRDRELRKP